MKRTILGLGFIIGALLLSGCTQPNAKASFNPSNKGMVFVQGKPYRVPYNSEYLLKKVLPETRVKHLFKSCRSDALIWKIKPGTASKNEKESLTKATQKNLDNWVMAKYNIKTKEEFNSNIDKLYSKNQKEIDNTREYLEMQGMIRRGYMGCSSPLTQQEYQYYLNQQNQRNENARVNAQIQQQQSQQFSNTLNTMNTNMAIQNAAMTNAIMPRTHNVNVTGSIYHY